MSSINFGGIPNVRMPENTSLDGSGRESGPNFTSVLSNAVQTVDQLHNSAAQQVSNLLEGGGADLNQVMVAVEKADVSFQLMMQVRNKIVSAYQDIEKMQF
jgi:flagellar hook-basal body complex protein FliE